MSVNSTKERTFIDLYLNGEVLAEDIDDYVDRWHEHPKNKEIYDFLGMTKSEYSLWLSDPDVLPHIARARKEQMPVQYVIRNHVEKMQMAARAEDTAEVRRLRRWLREIGAVD